MKEFLLKYRVAFLVFIGLIVLGVVVYYDTAPGGKLTVSGDLVNYNPSISLLYPAGRVGRASEANGGWRRPIITEPVYFDVRLPRQMSEVTVRLWSERNPQDVKVGLRLFPESGITWHYNFQSLKIIAERDGWVLSETRFNLLELEPLIEDRKIRLAISMPTLGDKGNSLVLHRIEVELTGEPFTFEVLRQAFINQWHKLNQYAD